MQQEQRAAAAADRSKEVQAVGGKVLMSTAKLRHRSSGLHRMGGGRG